MTQAPKLPRVILADDHTILSEAFRKLLEPHFEVVAAVADGHALIEVAPTLKPDVDELKDPCHVTGPLTLPPTSAKPAGTGNATPLRKISSLPARGTVVIQVLEPVSNVVDEQAAFGENVT